MKMADFSCKHCNKTFKARVVDRNRGWAQFCSKSCKAFHQAKLRAIMAEIESYDNEEIDWSHGGWDEHKEWI